jgi:hypothetical protein
MTKKSKSAGDKPRRQGKGRNSVQQRPLKSKDWDFTPRLKNEAIVLNSILDIYEVSFYMEIVENIRSLITSCIRNHGFTDGPSRYNIIKNYTIDLIELRNPENPGWISTSESWRIPSKLGINFITLIVDYFNETSSLERAKYYQVIITILNISRIIDGLSPADYSSVTDKASSIDVNLLTDFETYVSEKLKTFKYESKKTNLSSYKVNFKKSGPSGIPKLESAEKEAVALLKSKYRIPFRNLCSELGLDHLFSYVSALSLNATQESSEGDHDEQTLLRKLVSIPDSGFKTRIVAIVDFWTQLALQPLRAHVQKVISKLYKNTDFRMNQDQGVKAMVDFQKRSIDGNELNGKALDIEKLFFYDISSWTDRFHRDLQKITVRNLFTPRLAQAWAQLTVHCEWYVSDTGRTIKYGQGQGMGTNGSFDIATLTDHLYINYIYDRVYKEHGLGHAKGTYGKVGDDLWIYDPEELIPIFYEKINLPINISKSKTHCKVGSIAEFCSRTFWNTIDVSRISPKIISKSKDFRYLPLLICYCSNRGILLNRKSFTVLEDNLLDSDETYFDKLQPWIISAFILQKEEPDSAFAHLNLDYLIAGNWITKDTECILNDQATLRRISISRSIVKILKSYGDIKVKTLETIEAEGDLDMEEVFMLQHGKHDLYDHKSPNGLLGLKFFKSNNEILKPKQLVVLERFITQSKLVSDEFFKIYEIPLDSENYFSEVEELLLGISTRSVYDQGNINYDSKRFLTEQYSIVDTLNRLDAGFETLTIDVLESALLDQITGEEMLVTELLSGIITIKVAT